MGRQKGAGNLGCVVGLLVLAAVVVIGIKAVPARVAVAELQDYCERAAETAAGAEDEVIADRILQKANELRLPVPAEAISVSRDSSSISILVRYTVVLDFPFYTYNWNVEHNVRRVLF